MDNELYHIDEATGKFVLNKRTPELQYINRYLPRVDPNDKEEIPRTLRDLGWSIHLTDSVEIKDEAGEVRRIEVHPCNTLVTFCPLCNGQHSFILTRERIKKNQKTGREYTAGYYGYCMGCYDKLHGIAPSGRA
jgi:hypothetical protein